MTIVKTHSIRVGLADRWIRRVLCVCVVLIAGVCREASGQEGSLLHVSADGAESAEQSEPSE